MKYRSVVRQDKNKEFVIIQRKEGLFGCWEYFCKCDTIEEADSVVRGISEGTVTTGIYNYDKSGRRVNESWM